MQFLSSCLSGLLVVLIAAAITGAATPFVLAALSLGGMVFLLISVLLGLLQSRMSRDDILVDGSNVMHWAGQPSLDTLIGVLEEVRAAGLKPLVIFDANAGYLLFDRYAGPREFARQLGLPSDQVVIVHKGVPADKVLLKMAQKTGARIITNDNYRDWSRAYPAMIGDRDRFVNGKWSPHGVRWSNPALMLPV